MAESVSSSDDQHGSHRASDPTQLTTATIQREIAHLSDRIDLKIEGVVTALSARIDAIDRATTVFSDNLTRVPTEVQRSIASEHAVTDEKFATIISRLDGMAELKAEQFHAIQQQFEERDVRSATQTESSKVAVDAALQAAEKAVNKQTDAFALASAKAEASFVKQIDQLGILIQANTRALDDKIADAKDRLSRIEAAGIGATTSQRDTHSASTLIIAIIAVIFAALSAAAAWVHTALR